MKGFLLKIDKRERKRNMLSVAISIKLNLYIHDLPRKRKLLT